MYQIRTDLALETQEGMMRNNQSLRGVLSNEESKENGITVSTVEIISENAAKQMGRPRGNYITIEAKQMSEDDEEYKKKVASEFATVLKNLLKESVGTKTDLSVLVIGLGNREVTPDALGPRVVDNLYITRHVIKEFGDYAFGEKHVNKVSGLVPGVMAQTGMESLEIIRGVAKETKPDVVITVDALAARSTKRLGRTVQLTNTGIVPGSGVGNHRNAINKESIGVDVISIGVPTVVDAATIVADAVNANHDMMEKFMSPQLNGMFVTPKSIDDTINKLSFLIADGINLALS